MSYPENVVHEDERYKLTLVADEHPSSDCNPRQDGDANLGTMWCKHRDYTLGDDGSSDIFEEVSDFLGTVQEWLSGDDITTAMVKHIARKYGATVVMPLYLLDHSGITISAGANLLTGGTVNRRSHFSADPGGWDTSFVGFIFDTAAKVEEFGVPVERIQEALDNEVKYYARYLEGDVWGYRLEEKIQVHTERTVTRPDGTVDLTKSDTEQWDEIDSCWGFLGDDHAKDEGMSALQGYLTSNLP